MHCYVDKVLMFYFQDKKDQEFQDVRTETNTCHNEVNTALGQMQQVRYIEMVETVWKK